MNLAHIINEYLEMLGYRGLKVTELVKPHECLTQWTVYANDVEIGSFETAELEPSTISIVNEAIYRLADYEGENGRIL